MKVYFESSGGFAGLHTSIILDTDSINSEDAQQLRDLITNSNFFDLPSESSQPKPGSADYMRYKITVHSDEQIHTVKTNDTTMPSKLSPLIKFLQSRAKIN
jgi:hypothetical protein